jgi:imidazole glycerol-phosphate synthase subunit HisH
MKIDDMIDPRGQRCTMTTTLVFDYGFARPDRLLAALSYLGIDSKLSANVHDIRLADRLVIPDGDDTDRAMEQGVSRDVFHAFRTHIEAGKPTLTVGLGTMFLLAGNTHPQMPGGLEVFAAPIQRFDPRMVDENEKALKCPHVGFGFVVGLDRHPGLVKSHALTAAVGEGGGGAWFYFRHRLCAPARVPFSDVAVCHHGVPFAGAIWKNKVLALQFLPELSGEIGLHLLDSWFKEVV